MPPEVGKRLQLSIIQALQIGARNSSEYQTHKEDIFRSALNLDLKRDGFGFTWKGQAESSISVDKSGESSGSGTGRGSLSGGPGSTSQDTVKGIENSGSLSLSKTLKTGAKLTAALAVDLVNLLTQGGASSLGIVGDATISIPLF